MIPEPTEALPAAMIEAAVAYQARTPFPGAGKGSEWIAGLYLAMEAAREPEAGKLREALEHAYCAGAMDVHENWQEDRDPDFTEAAHDYAANTCDGAAANTCDDADSGMSGDAVALAEMVWAQLPVGNRSWAGLATHEKALVCHTLARLTALSRNQGR
jgi:hypothetical protein